MVSATVIYAAVPISAVVVLGLVRKWRSRNWAKCTSNTCLRGKTFLITGANSGIGLETAKALVKRKARVIFACRDIEKAKQAVAQIRHEQVTGGELIPMQLDLASFESIEKFVEVVKAGFNKIDVLINNAGVVIPLELDMKTKEGFEIHLGVNHLGHMYLTNLLLDLLKKATPSRYFIKWYHYILMAPVAFLFMKSAKQGAETVVFTATDYGIEGHSGKFYSNCAEYISPYPFDKNEETKLYERSEEMIKSRKPL
ncbi:jg12854 [Pararge aegeria aegeria]|uniref:Jg12854 protein n=1 Tax=Pararge aegeria aegeria TaxID=348720 RepID=A0A8S4S433_9NEOP|nr:jg12854 [Pararge aegeria aegeria]